MTATIQYIDSIAHSLKQQNISEENRNKTMPTTEPLPNLLKVAGNGHLGTMGLFNFRALGSNITK